MEQFGLFEVSLGTVDTLELAVYVEVYVGAVYLDGGGNALDVLVQSPLSGRPVLSCL